MWISKITKAILDKLKTEVQRDDNKAVFQAHVLDPIIHHALRRLYPYILVTSIIFFLTFVLAVAILFLVIQTNTSGGTKSGDGDGDGDGSAGAVVM